MDKPIKSEALTKNLKDTNVAVELDTDALWLVGNLQGYFGIQQRCNEFLFEVYHAFSNPEVTMALMRKVLGDMWVFFKLADPGRSLKVLLDAYFHVWENLVEPHHEHRMILEMLELLERISKEDKGDYGLFPSIVNWLEGISDSHQLQLIRLGSNLRKSLMMLPQEPELQKSAQKLLVKIFEHSFRIWEGQIEQHGFSGKDSFPDRDYWNSQHTALQELKSLQEAKSLPSYSDIANMLRGNVIAITGALKRLEYILQLLRLEGMLDLQSTLLRDLNREFGNLYKEVPQEQIPDIIDSVFATLEDFHQSHLSIVLDCLLDIGQMVIQGPSVHHAKHFIQRLTEMEFTPPGEVSIRADWQLDTDKNHIKHIRLLMKLIGINPTLCKDLLAYLVINVTHHGIFISDEDLFQKDVSNLLNTDIRSVFVQLRHLLRQVPVFYSEIGAEGEIRDVSTAIDELTQRKDRLIHFLRKQVHTESNNTHIRLCAAILDYWTNLDASRLDKIIPEDVKLYLLQGSELVKKQSEAVRRFLKEKQLSAKELLALSWQGLERTFDENEQDLYIRRLRLLCSIHLLLKDKYELDPHDIVKFLARYKFFDSKEQNRLRTSLVRRDYESSIRQLLSYIGKLNSIILNPQPSAGWDNIYYKRHIAAGIPSMYGTYREPKLEAMGMVFRIENVARRLFERSITQININYLNGRNLRRIVKVLELYDFSMQQEMLTNYAYSSTVAMLDSLNGISSASLEQYQDTFRLLKDSVNEIVSEYYYRFYDPELKKGCLGTCGPSSEMQAEAIYRKLLMGSFMIQGLDVFITNLLESLSQMKRLFKTRDIMKLMSYDPDRLFVHLHSSHTNLDNQVSLGSKAFFLKRLWHFEYPIPPGFVLTTELYRNRDIVNTHPDISDEFDVLLHSNLNRLERHTRTALGDPTRPLLLSVRSGAPMSLPGAMDTFLNIGLNDEVTLLLSKQPNYGWTAWDCYRRLIQSWGMSHGIDRDEFDAVMLRYKQIHKVELKTQFSPQVMQEMTYDYKEVLAAHGIHLEQDPFRQLYRSISHVLDSWNTDRARAYRRKLQISDQWGTAVIIQKMVMGNISLESGSGVLFTHAEWSEGPGICLNGDFTLCSQGEDVVAGLVHTLPISEAQARHQEKDAELSLERRFPAVYHRILRLANQLIKDRNFPHQEIEFTFEGPAEDQLFILQTRNQVIRKVPDYMVLYDIQDTPRLGSGIGIGKGAINGLIVITEEDIKKFKDQKQALILVRPDTVPDDMVLLFECQGLLTARGGITSHAAVTATRLGLIGIVNCWDLSVNETDSTCRIGNLELKAGDPISLDATSGAIYEGYLPLRNIHEKF